jgi:predicted SAM-dependent methyltransferase
MVRRNNDAGASVHGRRVLVGDGRASEDGRRGAMAKRRRPLGTYGPVKRLVARIRRNRRLLQPRLPASPCLNVGCGPAPVKGLVNVDYDWTLGQELVWDVRRRMPFADGSVAGIFSEHMLEHMTLAEAMTVLREFRRVLAPGGVVRIVVPDGDLYFEHHRAGTPMPYADADRREFPIYTPMVSVNRIFRSHGHKFMFDFATLAVALTAAGFRDPEKLSFGVGRDPRLLVEQKSRAIESLYAEAHA